MKSLIAAIALISTNAFAGVIGHVHFQKASTWVNAYYSKSLCLDGDTFRATVSMCLEYGQGDERPCLSYGKVKISQPQESTRQRCASHSEGDCQEWETVRYFQSENITVQFTDRNGNVTGTKDITVPNCK